jgi:hypothetical protein
MKLIGKTNSATTGVGAIEKLNMRGIPRIEVAVFATKTAMNNLEKLMVIFESLKHTQITSISTGMMLRKTKILPVFDKRKGAAILAIIN